MDSIINNLFLIYQGYLIKLSKSKDIRAKLQEEA